MFCFESSKLCKWQLYQIDNNDLNSNGLYRGLNKKKFDNYNKNNFCANDRYK